VERGEGALEGLGLSFGWSGRRVLVTGATGLVGSWLVAELVRRGAATVCLVRDADPQSELLRSGTIRRTSVVNGELEDYRTVERAIVEHEIETVFHLGAQTIVGSALRSPLNTFESNIRGSYNLLEACRVHSGLVRRVVVASSDKAYGDVETLPYDESMPPLGRHPYDVSKSCTDLLAQTYHHTYGLPVVIARCGNIYGGGDLNWSRIVPGTIRSLHRGERPIIRSDGQFRRDYVYVMDAVEAYLRMAEALEDPAVAGEAFNFGPSQPKTVLEVVSEIARAMDREDLEPVVKNEARAEIRDQFLDSSKAERMLGLRPTASMEAGLCETVAWYRKLFAEGGEA
jgi:CDP-glucose 4,6-dehydratase